MLEATILLHLWLGKTAPAAVVAVLLAFNPSVSMVQEDRDGQSIGSEGTGP